MPDAPPSASTPTAARAAPRSASRAVVVAVLVVLIVVAAAGIVLAGRQASRAPAAPEASASAPAVPPTAGADVSPTGAASGTMPTSFRFAAGNAALPADQAGALAAAGDALRASGQRVALTVRFVGGTGSELARRRVEAVQHALQSNGIPGSRIQTETIEVPAGSLLAGDVDRVELAAR